jgi:hypothetical protein
MTRRADLTPRWSLPGVVGGPTTPPLTPRSAQRSKALQRPCSRPTFCAVWCSPPSAGFGVAGLLYMQFFVGSMAAQFIAFLRPVRVKSRWRRDGLPSEVEDEGPRLRPIRHPLRRSSRTSVFHDPAATLDRLRQLEAAGTADVAVLEGSLTK